MAKVIKSYTTKYGTCERAYVKPHKPWKDTNNYCKGVMSPRTRSRVAKRIKKSQLGTTSPVSLETYVSRIAGEPKPVGKYVPDGMDTLTYLRSNSGK